MSLCAGWNTCLCSGTCRLRGREGACAGNLTQFMETLLFFPIICMFHIVHHHIHAVQRRHKEPKGFGTGLFVCSWQQPFPAIIVAGPHLWPFCLWCSTRQELQYILCVWLSARLRGFRSDWAHYTNLFTMEFDRFYFHGECFHKKRPKIQAQHVTPEQSVHSLSHSNLLMCFMCNSSYS